MENYLNDSFTSKTNVDSNLYNKPEKIKNPKGYN